MCLAISGKITEINETDAKVDFNGVSKYASIRLVSGLVVGDFVLVHAGFIIEKLDKEHGEELLKILDETMRLIT